MILMKRTVRFSYSYGSRIRCLSRAVFVVGAERKYEYYED